MTLAAIIAWIATNPAIIEQGADAVINLVNTAIGAFQRHQQGTITLDQLQAEWVAAGIPLKVIEDAATAAGL